nr:metallophosphoesterase [uncultured Oscillibacter sp.]
MDRNEIIILHCSDLHYGFENWEYAKPEDIRLRRERLNGFLEIIENFPVGWQPSILVISGDIAWTGAEQEYKMFLEDFLHPVLLKTNIKKECVILCIGNHDKDDTKSGHFNRPNSQADTPCELYPGDLMPWLTDAFPAFLNMCHSEQLVELKNTVSDKIRKKSKEVIPFELEKQANYVYGYRPINEIDFLILNSAWDCYHVRETDRGLIRIGSQLLDDSINQMQKNDKERVVITVFHHPMHWFHPTEEKAMNTIKSYSDIVLYGHEHAFAKDESKGCILLCASTLSSNDTVDFGFELIKITYTQEELSPTVSIARGVSENIDNEVEWTWKISAKEEALGKRPVIAKREYKYKKTIAEAIDDIVSLTMHYAEEEERFKIIRARYTNDFASAIDRKNDLSQLETIFGEVKAINTKIEQLQSDLGNALQGENIMSLRNRIHDMLEMVAFLLVTLRKDPFTNAKNSNRKHSRDVDEPDMQLKLTLPD